MPNPDPADYQVTPQELDYDETASLPGAEDRGKATAQAAAGIQSKQAAAKVVRDLPSVEGAITGTEQDVHAPSPSPTEPSRPLLQPHQFDMKNYNDLDKLKAAATRGGLDVSKISDSTWNRIQGMYVDAHDPGIQGTIKHWMGATGAGAFMQGWDNGAPSDTIPLTTLEKISPQLAENRKAIQFFGHNIQTRLYEGGQYITPDGRTYVAPDSYKMGKLIGSVMANPAAVLGTGAAAAGSSWATEGTEGSAAQGVGPAIKAAFQTGMQKMGQAGQSLAAMAQRNPQIANAISHIAGYGALGWMMHGGRPPPAL